MNFIAAMIALLNQLKIIVVEDWQSGTPTCNFYTFRPVKFSRLGAIPNKTERIA
jgi:hypothetical protein